MIESTIELQDDNKMNRRNKRRKIQRKISLDTWENVERQSVEQLPVGIDGVTVYEIKEIVPDRMNCFKTEESGRKPDLLSRGGMLAHDLRTVKVL